MSGIDLSKRKPENIEEMADALMICINNNTKESIRQSIINGFTYLLNSKLEELEKWVDKELSYNSTTLAIVKYRINSLKQES